MSAQFAPVPGPSWTRVDEMPERSNDLDAEDEFEDEEVRDGSVLALARWASAQRAFVDLASSCDVRLDPFLHVLLRALKFESRSFGGTAQLS